MIGSLRGTLLDRGVSDAEVLVEVAGVGYRVTVAPATAVTVGEVGHEVFLHIHHHIREDAQTLYGFTTADERRCFEALLGAHGVGPALALAILSVHEPRALQQVLAEDDLDALCLVPGVGRKTATRLLVELKSRLDLGELDVSQLDGAAGADGPTSRRDVQEALTGLGYGPDEIREVLRELPGDGDSALLLRIALQRLAVAS